jgi:DNA-binding MarR family transcriptional regulator
MWAINLLNSSMFLYSWTQNQDSSMIIDNSRLQYHIMYALSDSHMHKILQSTSLSVKSVTEIIREQDLPHSSAYKKIAELVKWGLLVPYKSELVEGKKVAYYKSTFHSIKISYEGSQKTKVEAEPNPDALERISLRFYDL